jgi:putative flippase GtrA
MDNSAQPDLDSRAPAIPEHGIRAIRDSRRTYFVLLRFVTASLLSTVIDNLIFYLVYHSTGMILGAQVAARTVSVFFNYRFVQRAVFSSDRGHHVLLPRYLALVALNAAISYAGIRLLLANTPLGVVPAKIVTETLLFIANFLIQRAFIFTRRQVAQPTSGL